ncbi:MAG: long-chain fatty acid--CoA ligase [Defluviicoccus sp.]|nr:long-chain fatty acid--CoA ligase [Defluviicoccus sp.]
MAEPALSGRVLDFIARESSSEDAFDALALALFAHQFENNESFRRFCLKKGRTPRAARSWREIPPVPISAFKTLTLSCVAPEETERVFMTSGTTGGARGRCYHPTLAVYDRSMIENFRARFMRGRERIRMGVLFPTEEEMPNSSLAHYLALAVENFGTPDSEYLLDQKGLENDRLFRALGEAVETGEPCALLGATYSFVHAFDEMGRGGRSWRLPPGSRVLDTGGVKGRSRDVAAGEFYARMKDLLGVAPSDCINMYGMTELSTQFYDDGNDRPGAPKSGPHWIRSRVVDPLSGADVPDGEPGILVHCDLANYNSAAAIMTEDVGVACAGGFVLLGRADDEEAQGCSMAVAEFLEAARG